MKTWAEYTKDEKIAFLRSEKRDLLAQAKRQVHTSRSGGVYRRIDQIDRQLRELEAA